MGKENKNKFIFTGKWAHKLDFHPLNDDTYMNFKLEEIKKSAIPARTVQQLDRAQVKFKPVANHQSNVSIVLTLPFIIQFFLVTHNLMFQCRLKIFKNRRP